MDGPSADGHHEIFAWSGAGSGTCGLRPHVSYRWALCAIASTDVPGALTTTPPSPLNPPYSTICHPPNVLTFSPETPVFSPASSRYPLMLVSQNPERTFKLTPSGYLLRST